MYAAVGVKSSLSPSLILKFSVIIILSRFFLDLVSHVFSQMNHFLDQNFIKRPRLRRLLTRLLEGQKEINVYLLGSRFLINTTKEHGYLRASRLASSSSLLKDEIPIIITLASILEEGDVFLDIGANIGIYSVTLSKLSALKKVGFYAFEANPDTFCRLESNCNGKSICPMNYAISDHDGKLDFVGGAVSHVFTSIHYSNQYSIQGEITSVASRRLDGLGIIGDSLVMKIDVEGQELEVLRGSEKLFLQNRVRAIYLDGCNNAEEVKCFLTDRGFYFLDGRTLMEATETTFSLLALKRSISSTELSNKPAR